MNVNPKGQGAVEAQWGRQRWQSILGRSGLSLISRGQWDTVGDQSRWLPPHGPTSFRDETGRTWEQPTYRTAQQIGLIAVHETLRSEDIYGSEFARARTEIDVVRRILELHTSGRIKGETRLDKDGQEIVGEQRTDISYGLLIARSGTIYEGRRGGPYVQQAGTFGANNDGIHVALLGDFDHHHPTSKQLKTLSKVLASLCREMSIDPLGSYRPPRGVMKTRTIPTICGHADLKNEYPGKQKMDCPGVNLHRSFPEIRRQVATELALPSQTATQAEHMTGSQSSLANASAMSLL